MPTFVTIGANGELTASSDFSFSPDCVEVNFEVVRGLDGRLYRASEVPVKPGKTVNEKIADIEAEYQKKFADLDASLLAALWAGGANEVANRQALSAKRQQLTADKTAAITNVFLNG